MGIFSKNFIEEDFDLKRAILNNEVNIIFGDSKEFLEEIAHLRGSNRMEIIIRNSKEDFSSDSLHGFSMKFIPARDIRFASHDGKRGIPITFKLLSRRTENGVEYYLSNWEVFFGGSDEKITLSKRAMKELNKREKQFISSVVNQYGMIILEYWDLNPNEPAQYKRLKELEKYIENQLI